MSAMMCTVALLELLFRWRPSLECLLMISSAMFVIVLLDSIGPGFLHLQASMRLVKHNLLLEKSISTRIHVLEVHHAMA